VINLSAFSTWSIKVISEAHARAFRQLSSVPHSFSWRDVNCVAASGLHPVAARAENLHPCQTQVKWCSVFFFSRNYSEWKHTSDYDGQHWFASCISGKSFPVRWYTTTGRSDDRRSIPGDGWELLSSTPCPDRLWGPPSLQSNGVKLTTHIHLAWSSSSTPQYFFMACCTGKTLPSLLYLLTSSVALMTFRTMKWPDCLIGRGGPITTPPPPNLTTLQV